MDHAFGIMSKNSEVLELVSFVIISKCIVLCFTCKSMIHFEFIFIQRGLAWGLFSWVLFRFVSFCLQIPSSSSILGWKGSPFSPRWLVYLRQKQNKQKLAILVWGYFWVLYAVPWISLSVPLPIPPVLIDAARSLKSGRVILPTLFFFRIVLAILILLLFVINFRKILSIYKKKKSRCGFDRKCATPSINWGRTDIFTTLHLLDQEQTV